MADAKKDDNRVPTLIATLNTDGETMVNVTVNPSTHGLDVDDDTSGSDMSSGNADRDGNRRTGLIGVSSADGVTPVEVYADSSGNLLINST